MFLLISFLLFYLFLLARAFLSVIPAERRILKKSECYFVDKDRFHQCAKYGTVPILHSRELEPERFQDQDFIPQSLNC